MSTMTPEKITEKSFTLIESVIAVGLMVTILLEVGNVQGRAIYFAEYSQSMTKGIYLAKKLMSQIEYQYESTRNFSDLKAQEKERPFDNEPEFFYNLTIDDLNLPLTQLLFGGGSDEEDGNAPSDQGEDNQESGQIESILEQVFADEPKLKMASVEVYWAEGAKKQSVSLAMILTNNFKVDQQIALFSKEYTALINKEQKVPTDPPKNGPTPTDPPKNGPASTKPPQTPKPRPSEETVP